MTFMEAIKNVEKGQVIFLGDKIRIFVRDNNILEIADEISELNNEVLKSKGWEIE